MKCEFTAKGVLKLIPDNEVEQFALSKWDRTQIEVMEKDHFFSMLESGYYILDTPNA